MSINPDGPRRTPFQLLSLPEIEFTHLEQLDPELRSIEPEIQSQLAKDALYSNYIDRQKRDVELLRKDELQEIPANFDYSRIDGLSNELKLKLGRAQPANLSQASRVDGMTPAALTLLLAKMKQAQREKSA